MEAVLGGMVLQVGDEPGDVDYCHVRSSRPDGLPQQGRCNRLGARESGPQGWVMVATRCEGPGGSRPVGC